jgi:Flp pilus assembly pilin Flp
MKKLLADRKGQDMVEYALITAFVASSVVALAPAIAATSTYLSTVVNILQVAIAQTAGN